MSNLVDLVDDLHEWIDAGPRFWGPVLSFVPWLAFLGLTVVDAALAFLCLRFLLRRRPESWKALLPGLACLALAAGFFAARFSLFYVANQFTSLFWVALIATGMFWLATDGYVLPVLYFCFLAGVAQDVLNLPASAMCAVWPLAAGFGVWKLSREGRRPVTMWLLGATGVASLFGFGPQAVMLAQALFMLHLAVYVSGTVQRGLDRLAGDRVRSLANLARPLAVTTLAALFIAWVLVFMGGPGLVEHAFRPDLDRWPRLDFLGRSGRACDRLFFAAPDPGLVSGGTGLPAL